ncbi:MAG: hypothetical protein PF495_00075 [Spirochaetales bacterium]|jgi:hypothetical protein|nr:hypothetical protein [Spirochaetales bacterium]
MKKIKNLLSTKEEVVKVRSSLEQKTAKAFDEYAKSKYKTRELSHLKYLD